MFARVVDIDIVYTRRDLYYSRVRASPRDISETARNWMAPRGAVRCGAAVGRVGSEVKRLRFTNITRPYTGQRNCPGKQRNG